MTKPNSAEKVFPRVWIKTSDLPELAEHIWEKSVQAYGCTMPGTECFISHKHHNHLRSQDAERIRELDEALKGMACEHETKMLEQIKKVRELEKHSDGYIIYYNMYNICLEKLAVAADALNKIYYDFLPEKNQMELCVNEIKETAIEALERIKGSEGEKK